MISAWNYVKADPTAVTTVLQSWKARWPAFGVLALLPEKQAAQVTGLQQAARELDAPLMGAVFPLLITEEGFSDEGVWLLCFEHMPPAFLLEDIADTTQDKFANAVAPLLAVPGAHPGTTPILLTIFDSMVPNIGTLMDDLHLGLSNPPLYVGVNAGSETFQPMPCLFDRERTLGGGVLGLLLQGQAKPVVRHDYPVSKSLMQATSAEGNTIITIDNRPAFEVYQEVIASEYGVTLTAENFYEYAVHFPFGVAMAIDVLVRIPVALGEDQSLVCVGEIPPNSMLRLLRAPDLPDSTCVASICASLPVPSASPEDAAMLTFYCAGRRMHFQDDACSELAQLRDASGRPHLFGALSLGEIGNDEEFHMPRFHNTAIVCLT
jgi:hypothetical protein